MEASISRPRSEKPSSEDRSNDSSAGEDEFPTEQQEAGAGRRGGRFKKLVVFFCALMIIGLASMLWLDHAGKRFYRAGAETVELFGQIAESIETGYEDTFSNFLGRDYRGSLLGLASPVIESDRDGVRISLFQPGEPVSSRAALDELGYYLQHFESFEDVGLHVHRLESWGAEQRVVIARLEIIGQPVGEARSGIDRALIRVRLAPRSDREGWVIVGMEMIEGYRVIATEPHMVNVASMAGIDFENRYYPPFLEQEMAFEMLRFGPAGITTVDLDADGWHDLFIPDGEQSRLFLNNRDGSFRDATEESGLGGHDGVSVALFADWDNDGDKDAFISRTFTPNRLLRNDGGRFVDITAESGLGEDCCTTVASAGDVDSDGDLDLYVGRYLDPRLAIPTTFYARNGEPNRLYLNDGSGSFTDVTEASGVGELGLCLGTVFGDYDNDGDLDLYVVNDFGRKTLYRHEGLNPDGVPRYTDVTVDSGTLAYGAGMSASFGDYDNDGLLDIYVAHIRSEHGWFAEWPTVGRYMFNSWRQGVWRSDMPLYWEMIRQSGADFVGIFQQMASGNTLLRNRGDGSFEDTTWAAQANPPGWFWGSGFIDFDNDGWLDIYAANGWVYAEPDTEIELGFLNNVVSEQDTYKTGVFFDPANFDGKSWHGHERNRHLLNRGDGTFIEIGHAAGSDLLLNSRGIAVADFWNRGVADVAIAASTDRHALLRNEIGAQRDWLGVELQGAGSRLADGSNVDAVGARLRLEHAGQTQIREVVLGDGYGSQNSLRQLFGLGGSRDDGPPVVERLTVTWPRSGRTQVFEQLEGNRIVRITEDESELVDFVAAASDDEGGSGLEEPESLKVPAKAGIHSVDSRAVREASQR